MNRDPRGSVPAVRVLLLGGSPSQWHAVGEALAAAPGAAFEISRASRLADGLAHLERTACDVVLVDVPLPDASLSEALPLIVAARRSLAIVLLVATCDVVEARSALAAWAAAYVIKDALWMNDAARLRDAVRTARLMRGVQNALSRPGSRSRVPERARARTVGAVLALVGASGGHGTTSIGLRLARELARRGADTVLLELERGSLAALCGLATLRRPRELWYGAPEDVTETILDQVLCTVGPHLKVLLAPGPGPTEQDPPPPTVTRILQVVSRMAAHVVVDLPCAATAALEAVVRVSSLVGVVAESPDHALRQARQVVDLLASWSVTGARVGALVVHRSSAPPEDAAVWRSALSCDVLATIPVPPGARIALRPGEDESRLPGREALTLCVNNLADRLAPQTRVV